MTDLRILGVAVQLLVALLLLALGTAALAGRVGAPRLWDRLWGRTPQRVDGAALAVLGLGVGAWALTQTVDLVPLTAQLAAIAVVLLGAAAVIGVQTRVPDDTGTDPHTDPPR